jgi:hypothetical protein
VYDIDYEEHNCKGVTGVFYNTQMRDSAEVFTAFQVVRQKILLQDENQD